MSEHPRVLLPLHLRQPAPDQKVILRHLVLTDGIIQAFRHHPQLRAEFPFVNEVPRSIEKPPCGRCGKGKSRFEQVVNLDLNKIKENIRNLGGDRLTRFKTLLGASEITFFQQTPNGPQKFTM
jgi:hypothetical protein